MANKKKTEDTTSATDVTLADPERRSLLKQCFGDMMYDEDRNTGGVIPTSSYMINYILGVGGIPLGRVVQLAGAESSGKTTLCMDIMKNAEQMGYSFLYFDAEQTFNVDLAKQMGIRTPPSEYLSHESRISRILAMLIGPHKDLKKQEGILLPDSSIGDMMLNQKKLKLIIIDSLNSLITPKVEKADLEKSQMGALSAYLSQYLPLLVPKLSYAGVTLIGIQQLRDNIGQMFGDTTTVSGGRAWKHNVSVALNLTPRLGKDDQIFDASGAKMGTTVKAYVSKSKVSRPYLSGDYKVVFGQGFVDVERELFNIAVRHGVLEKPNAVTYKFGGESWRGEDTMVKAIAASSELKDSIYAAVQKSRAMISADMVGMAPESTIEGYIDDDQEIV